ncbi:hypothetical protein E2C01_020970 [Portunus trituberculatus]|uniref:Uncharacterized protein n=1 Tax=Portunus trituberculatus TaxID=210409 RepID=A0A5B7E3Q6_PORTR|nr:hypothetical protein [Portunus trituberculatus]
MSPQPFSSGAPLAQALLLRQDASFPLLCALFTTTTVCIASLVELKASVGLPGGVVLCRGLTRRVGITDI